MYETETTDQKIARIQEFIYDGERAHENMAVLRRELADLKVQRAHEQAHPTEPVLPDADIPDALATELHLARQELTRRTEALIALRECQEAEEAPPTGEHVQILLREDAAWRTTLEANIAKTLFDTGASQQLSQQAACRIMKYVFGVPSITTEEPTDLPARVELTLSERVWVDVMRNTAEHDHDQEYLDYQVYPHSDDFPG